MTLLWGWPLNLKRAVHFFFAGLVCCWLPSVGADTLTVDVSSTVGEPLDYSVVFLEPLSLSADLVDQARPKAVIAQEQSLFIPAISVLQTGTQVEFPNLDTVRHHVYSFSEAKTFDIKLYLGRAPSSELFDRPGVVALGCNIHDAMIAWVVVVDTPYFAIADSNGRVSMDVPAGDYRLKVWDRRQLGGTEQARVVTVAGAQSLTLSVDASAFDPYTEVTGRSVGSVQARQ